MKQEEKTKRTYEKILNAAMIEFGTKSYENASLNTICNDHHISKGLIYHNFKNKDELYLHCVEACFRDMTAFLCKADFVSENTRESMEKLLALRQTFFRDNPYYSHIFFQTILHPPKHLGKELKAIRQDFDDFHSCRYRELLRHIKLREGITKEMALDYFFVYQEMFNGYFQNKAFENADFSSVVQRHERLLFNMLDLMLYGIAEKETSKRMEDLES